MLHAIERRLLFTHDGIQLIEISLLKSELFLEHNYRLWIDLSTRIILSWAHRE